MCSQASFGGFAIAEFYPDHLGRQIWLNNVLARSYSQGGLTKENFAAIIIQGALRCGLLAAVLKRLRLSGRTAVFDSRHAAE